MKTRIKVSLPSITTRDEAESLMTDLAHSVNAQRQVTAERDEKVLQVNRYYESLLATLDQAIQLKTDTLRAWAESSPDQFPKGRKSIDLLSGTLGFRTGTPKLALFSRAFTWEKVLSSLRSLKSLSYIRTKEEVDKDAILGDWSSAPNRQAFSDDYLRRVGLKVVQDESFFIEPKLTEVETRQTAEAK